MKRKMVSWFKTIISCHYYYPKLTFSASSTWLTFFRFLSYFKVFKMSSILSFFPVRGAFFNRLLLLFFRAAVKELVETEEEFGRDIQQVVERYLKPLDTPGVPRVVRDNKEIIFTNLKQIADFHNT